MDYHSLQLLLAPPPCFILTSSKSIIYLSELAHLPPDRDPSARSLHGIFIGLTEMKAKISPWWSFLNEKKKGRVTSLKGGKVGRHWEDIARILDCSSRLLLFWLKYLWAHLIKSIRWSDTKKPSWLVDTDILITGQILSHTQINKLAFWFISSLVNLIDQFYSIHSTPRAPQISICYYIQLISFLPFVPSLISFWDTQWFISCLFEVLGVFKVSMAL